MRPFPRGEREERLHRLVPRVEREDERSPVDGEEAPAPEEGVRLEGVLGPEVDVAPGRVKGADLEQDEVERTRREAFIRSKRSPPALLPNDFIDADCPMPARYGAALCAWTFRRKAGSTFPLWHVTQKAASGTTTPAAFAFAGSFMTASALYSLPGPWQLSQSKGGVRFA